MCFSIYAIVHPMTWEHKICNIVYLLISLIQYILCYYDTENSVYAAHCILTFRVYLRVYDFEATRHLYDPIGNWYFLCLAKVLESYTNLLILINNFEQSKLRVAMIFAQAQGGFISTVAGIYGLENLNDTKIFLFMG